VNEEEIGALVVDKSKGDCGAEGRGETFADSHGASAKLPEAQRLQTGFRDQLQRPASSRLDQTRCKWTMKFSFASFASFAVQDWIAVIRRQIYEPDYLAPTNSFRHRHGGYKP
jgi:hypothetical protein